MRTPILPHQIERITEGRYKSLHRHMLGVDLSGRHCEPIHRNVYYVDVRDPMGRQLVVENTPAKCMYRTGEIFCLYDERIPLTEPRLVHEFVHRAARRQVLFVWTSGLDTNRSRTLLNEVLTEYLTKCIMGERYADRADTRNLYRPLMGDIEALEKRIGRAAIVRAYLKGNYRFFRRQLSASRIRLPY